MMPADDEVGANRDEREARDGEHERDDRREAVDDAVRTHRRVLALEDEFHRVRERLQKAERADAVRAEADLEAREQPSLDQRHVRRRRHRDEHDDHRADECLEKARHIQSATSRSIVCISGGVTPSSSASVTSA